jgi:CRISPR/Cas system-associated endonuclease Cas1
MEYNTTRDKLLISEYGRNVQKLTKYCMSIEDKEKRTEFAKMIIQVMGQMNPSSRDAGDFKHKLWDHLYIISDFQLDVDAPYDPPDKNKIEARPERISYKENDIKYRMYGSNITKIIEKAIAYEEGEEKDALIKAIANHMKKSYLNWNRESVDDDLITYHLSALSKDKLELAEDAKLNSTGEILARNRKKKPEKPTKNFKQQNRRKGGKRY